MRLLKQLEPFITFEPRSYQYEMFERSLNKNSLIVLPTGLGKTAIAFLLIAYHLSTHDKKVLFLSPTKPLVAQHTLSAQKQLKSIIPCELTGATPPTQRQQLYNEHKLLLATPQVIENDLLTQTFPLEEYSLIIFDEAHRSTGNYAYTYIAKQASEKGIHLIGLTASPGSTQEATSEIVEKLFIEHIEQKNETDEDIIPFTHDKTIHVHHVHLPPEYKTLINQVNHIKTTVIQEINKTITPKISYVNKVILLQLQKKVQVTALQKKDRYAWHNIMLITVLIKLEHLLDVLTTQGIIQAHTFCEKIFKEQHKVKSSLYLSKLLLFFQFYKDLGAAKETMTNHPKMKHLLEIVQTLPQSEKIIIFTHYRDTGALLLDLLQHHTQRQAQLFFGQNKKNGIGLTQKRQKELIEEFRSDKLNTLIATSVAEEGLDIPHVNHLLFYEPISSTTRTVQRMGRTGRFTEGNIHILATYGTKETNYVKSIDKKQERMEKIITKIQKEKNAPPKQQQLITDKETAPKEVAPPVLVDQREPKFIQKHLSTLVPIQVQQLPVGDYAFGHVGIERKSYDDFIQSVIDKRIFKQAQDLALTYPHPLIIIESSHDIYNQSSLGKEALAGVQLHIFLTYKVPILISTDYSLTCSIIKNLHKKFSTAQRTTTLYTSPKNIKQAQQASISAIPGINATLAQKLLEHFGTLQQLSQATSEQLQLVPGIGKEKAQQIVNFFQSSY